MKQFSNGSRRWLEGLAVVGAAVALRAVVLFLTPDALEADPDGYRAVGENLVRHGVLGHGPYPTAVRPPLYPLILAGCAVFGSSARWVLGLVHLALGTATVWLAWDLARMGRLRRWQQWMVAGLVAGDPLLVRASTQVMTETLAALLATAAWNLWGRYLRRPTAWRAGLLGAILGIGVLCRPEWLLVGFAAAGMLLFRSAGWTSLAAYGAAAGMVLAPWPVRNRIQFGQPILTTTHGGYTMLLANNQWLYEHLRQGGALADWNPAGFHQAWHQTVEERFLRKPIRPSPNNAGEDTPFGKKPFPLERDSTSSIVDELAADRWAYREAIRTIGENPGIFCRAVLFRWGRLWQIVPSRIGESYLD
ncbi:MAG TPA: glycosyltransferase family 39 protein, partial [Thermoguttaceae bacterium]|nr:glycosyltransferase family 39 protein [Thermoguttaceae bacterium]